MKAHNTEAENTPIEILNDRGFKASSDLPFCLDNGIEYYIGSNGKMAAIIALMMNEDTYLLDKQTLRSMANDARTMGIKEVILYTNYGCEIHSKLETPSIVGLDKIIKIGIDGFNVGNADPTTPIKEDKGVGIGELKLWVTGSGKRDETLTENDLLIRTDDATIHLNRDSEFGKLARTMIDRYNNHDALVSALRECVKALEDSGHPFYNDEIKAAKAILNNIK